MLEQHLELPQAEVYSGGDSVGSSEDSTLVCVQLHSHRHADTHTGTHIQYTKPIHMHVHVHTHVFAHLKQCTHRHDFRHVLLSVCPHR